MIGAELGAAAAMVLALVFLWAGAAKIVAPQNTAASFAQLGLPWPRPLALGVPVLELLLGGALVAGVGVAAYAALAVLAAFTAVLARAVTSRQAVVCACFGAARTEPVSGVDLARNGLLALLAIAAAGSDGGWPTLPALVLVTTLAALGRVGLGVATLSTVTPLWPGEPQR